ncbi:hypothetical protein [Mycobacterium innocens]|uniref:hypothetical protein n=1 Tax=Mycobacterium innocens TaxID=2341083 RepID=UPI000A93E220|nr:MULTISPECIES: hypothetical protein [Mycobacterium]
MIRYRVTAYDQLFHRSAHARDGSGFDVLGGLRGVRAATAATLGGSETAVAAPSSPDLPAADVTTKTLAA